MSYEAKVTGELAGLTFQIEEVLDDLEEVNERTIDELRTSMDELKILRINMVKISCELKNIKVEDSSDQSVEPSKVDIQVEQLLKDSKKMLTTLKSAIKSKEFRDAQAVAEIQEGKSAEVASEKRARRYAFDAITTEMTALVRALSSKYNVRGDTDENVTKEVILERKQLKSSHAAEVVRLKSLSDRVLNYTDVQFDEKDGLMNSLLNKVLLVSELKEEFELKLHQDIEKLDLSDQMLKLAAQTKVNIGKFSGSLDKGLDYYTFKSKFLKAYANHPKTLLVEWLVNNHLEGRAKESIGSLDKLEDIWIRLKDNFGNVDQLLTHHIHKLTQLGSMQKIRSLDQKMFYVQNLVNVMKDTYDLAVEHDLTNDLHYGNHLTKIVAMIEKHLQSRWYKMVADEDIQKTDRWMKMHGFLRGELKILQICVAESPPEPH